MEIGLTSSSSGPPACSYQHIDCPSSGRVQTISDCSPPNMRCPSDGHLPAPLPPHFSPREPQHLHLCLSSGPTACQLVLLNNLLTSLLRNFASSCSATAASWTLRFTLGGSPGPWAPAPGRPSVTFAALSGSYSDDH